MTRNDIIERLIGCKDQDETVTGSYNAERKYIEWLIEKRKQETARVQAADISEIREDEAFFDEIESLYENGYRRFDFAETCVTKDTVICLNYKEHYKISERKTVEYDDDIYALIERPERVTRNLYAAHAFRLGDDIGNRRDVPMYNMAWDIEDEYDNPPYILEDPVYVQDLHQDYNILKGGF